MTDVVTLASYSLGRPVADFTAPYKAQDKCFASQRLDGVTIEDADLQHCTFANMGFKEARLQNGKFFDCIFIGCYFRRAQLMNCSFVGCRFIECTFPHAALKSCDFRYAVFRGCQVPFFEMEYCLPTEPNLREHLARNLALESWRLGLSQDARNYRRKELNAREEHLLAAVKGKPQWYKDHFDTLGRFRALMGWCLSLLNRWLWGYGDRAWTLVRNLLLLALLVFPGLFYAWRAQLVHSSGHDVSLWDVVYFSLENVVPSGIVSDVLAVGGVTRFLAGLESLFGVVVVALFAAYVFRWSLHR
ncbi:MAG: hypothetical protein GTO22_08685 [Gemmatimonadales bacterium]|nr:hypothetical protein [Gemmatimonadales bacterium]